MRVEFKAPEGFAYPEGLEDGDEMEVLATLQIKGDKLCLKAVDGYQMPGYGKDKSYEEAASEMEDE